MPRPRPQPTLPPPMPQMSRSLGSSASAPSLGLGADAALARRLQQELDDADRARSVGASGVDTEESESEELRPERLGRRLRRAIVARRPEGGYCVPATGACVGGVAGWFASLLGCGHYVIVCAIYGAISGHVFRKTVSRTYRRAVAQIDSDDDSSEDELNGVDRDTIEHHTAEQVYGATVDSRRPSATNGVSVADDAKCMICQEEFQAGAVLRALPCLHRYHKTCIDQWLARSCMCPICKHEITRSALPLR